MIKRIQDSGSYKTADLDGDGKVTDREITRTERFVQLDNNDKLQDQQRLMSWMAMWSMVVLIVVSMLPIIPVDRLEAMAGFLNTFFVSQAAVVSVFMGATAYSKAKTSETYQSYPPDSPIE